MFRPNLIAYIPTLNPRHLDWFERHTGSDLFLISQDEAEQLLPRLARNMAALPTEAVLKAITALDVVREVSIFTDWYFSDYTYIFPDEDVSHLFSSKYFAPYGCNVEFEMIWSRWDMTAVIQNQPVIEDVVVSYSSADMEFIRQAETEAQRSSDWWRQIGAIAVSQDGTPLALACNAHMPNEYEPYIFGDSGLNRDAGQAGKYTSIHAEQLVIARCAAEGLSLKGASLYVTTFPCEVCARMVACAGVSKLFFKEGYSTLNAQDVLRTYGVEIIRVSDPIA